MSRILSMPSVKVTLQLGHHCRTVRPTAPCTPAPSSSTFLFSTVKDPPTAALSNTAAAGNTFLPVASENFKFGRNGRAMRATPYGDGSSKTRFSNRLPANLAGVLVTDAWIVAGARDPRATTVKLNIVCCAQLVLML